MFYNKKYLNCFGNVLICFFIYCADVTAADKIDVVIDGVTGDIKANIVSLLSIEQQKSIESLSDERIKKLLKKGHKEINRALQPFGYYKAEVTSELTKTATGWRAHYIVDPGSPVLISNVNLIIDGEAKNDIEFKKYRALFPIVSGDRLDHTLYENSKTSLLNLAAERGYFDAVLLNHEIRLDLNNNSAQINLRIDTGLRYYFGNVVFKQSAFSEEFIKRFIPFKENEPYTLNKFLSLEDRLNDSDYFSKVEVKLRRDLAEDLMVPLEVTLVPRKRTKYTAGLGFGTDTGGRIKLGVERRRINKFGHKANTEIKASKILDSFAVRYIIPLKKPQSDQIAIAAAWEKEDINEVESTKKLLSASHSRLSGRWQKTYFINYEVDKFIIGADRDESTLVMPGLNWTHLRTNDRINTTFGNRFIVEVQGGAETLGSSSSFLQARFGAKFIRKLFGIGRIIARGDIAYSDVQEFNELPPSVRFFAGGDQSVRGYGFKTLGPVNTDGVVVGGKHLLVGSLEFEFRYDENWSFAVFYDAGNAMDTFSEKLKRGTGVGLRYKSVIGLFRIDLASALSEPGNPWRPHLSIGVDL